VAKQAAGARTAAIERIANHMSFAEAQFSFISDPLLLKELLPRHPQFGHHSLIAFVIHQEMTMDRDAAVFFNTYHSRVAVPI
jgi:hypothetical protein